MKIACACFLLGLALASPAATAAAREDDETYDLVVYGGTSAGVVAAIQASRMGMQVVLVERSEHLGGLSTAGLGATDIGNKAAIGGLAREFYRRLGQHYAAEEAWRFESRESFRSGRQRADEAEMWVFEPHVAEEVFERWIAEAGVEVLRGDGLQRAGGVRMVGTRIAAVVLKSGRTVRGRMFVDATYEGDLLAGAGVAYTVGREANATYGETLNGFQPRRDKHQFDLAVDPYRVPGDETSGLLPEIGPAPATLPGEGDRKVQAYCFRLCLTDAPENRLPFPRPADYDARRYELLARYFRAGFAKVPWNSIGMPNRKTDTNNNTAFSTDWLGASWRWPEASDEERQALFEAHRSYAQGLLWFLAHDERVPAQVQAEVRRWGLPKDEFRATGGWPHDLYVREGRRMIGEYVMTQHDCQGRRQAEDPVGLAAYTMDSHNVQRYAENGRVWNEGDVQVGGFPPYPISFRSIVPREAECANLVVPCALSASHIAFGSIRMEPVFMVLAQSAATAAVHALREGVAVQRVDALALRERLLADGQVLAWEGPAPRAATPALPGIVVDDAVAHFEGSWTTSTSVPGYVGDGYSHDGDEAKGGRSATFRARIPRAGRYELALVYPPHANRAPAVPVAVTVGEHRVAIEIDQRTAPLAGRAASLGTYAVPADGEVRVEVRNDGTRGFVVVDALWIRPVDGE